MMIKYKVSDVAKDFNVPAKEIIAVLADHNFAGKKSATALEEQELNVIFEHYTQKHNTDNLDTYFATANDKPKAEPVKEEPAVVVTTAEQTAAPAQKPQQGKAPAGKPQQKPQQAQGKPQPAPQPKAEVERRTVDTRKPQMVASNKYDEKFDVMAQTSNHVRGDGSGIKKQKINQKSKQQYKKPRRKETEQERLKRIDMERKKKQATIQVGDVITVGELAARLKATSAEVIKKLMMLGMMVSVNQEIDFDTAYLVAE